MGCDLDGMISRGLTEKLTFRKDTREVKKKAMLIPGGSIPDRRNSQCKGPEFGSMTGVCEEQQGGHWGWSGMKESRRECTRRGKVGPNHGVSCRSE